MSYISAGGVRLYESTDPRVRVGFYGVDNWRTVVQGEGGEWDTITGPPYRSKLAALAAVPEVARNWFATAAELDEYAASATGQLEAALRTVADLIKRIEAAMAIANGTSSYQKAQRMAEALAGHAEGEPAPVPALDGNPERARAAELRMARARHRGRERAELARYEAEVDAIETRYQARKAGSL